MRATFRLSSLNFCEDCIGGKRKLIVIRTRGINVSILSKQMVKREKTPSWNLVPNELTVPQLNSVEVVIWVH